MKPKGKAGLVMADSWRKTAKLQDTLRRQSEFLRKAAAHTPVTYAVERISTDRLDAREKSHGSHHPLPLARAAGDEDAALIETQ